MIIIMTWTHNSLFQQTPQKKQDKEKGKRKRRHKKEIGDK